MSPPVLHRARCSTSTLLLVLLLMPFWLSSQGFNWVHRLGNNFNGVSIDHMEVDNSGNIIIVGFFNGIKDFDPGPGTANLTSVGSSDIFIASYGPQGAYNWARRYGGSGSDWCRDIEFDSSGNIYICGRFQNTVSFGSTSIVSNGAWDGYLASFKPNGSIRWAIGMGAWNDDEATALTVSDSNHVYLTGYFRNVVDFDPSSNVLNKTSAGFNDAFVSRYDHQGNLIWVHTFGSSGSEVGSAIETNDSNGVIVGGYYDGPIDFDPDTSSSSLKSPGIRLDVWFASYKEDGKFNWVNTIDGTVNDDYLTEIQADDSGHVYLSGGVNGTADFDPDTTIVLGGGAGGLDIFLAKYDQSDGSLEWINDFGTTSTEWSRGMDVDDSGYVYMSGNITRDIDFDPGSGTFILTVPGTGNQNIFGSRFKSNGELSTGFSIGSSTGDYSTGICSDDNGGFYLSGEFHGLMDFNPGVGVDTIRPINFNNAFLAKYSNCVSYFTLDSVSICEGDSILLPDGSVTYDSLIDTSVVASYKGCDSTVVTFVSVKPSYVYLDSAIICSGESFYFRDGTTSTIPRTHHSVFFTSLSCDSIFIERLDTVGVNRGIVVNENFLESKLSGGDYQWFDCDKEQIISGETKKKYTPDSSGSFAVIVSNSKCSDTSNCVDFTSTVGIIEKQKSEIEIYPNPSSGEINVLFSDPITVITIHSAQGELVYQENLNGKTSSLLSLPSSLENGLYFVDIRTDNGIETRKLILKRE